MPPSRTPLPTGVPGLDRLLGGGIPPRQSLLITGEPGTGKTVLACQIAYSAVARGERVVLATTTSENQEKLLQDLSGFSFFEREKLGEELFFLSIYSWLKKGPRDAREVLVNTVRDRRVGLLIVDGVRTVRDLWQDEARLREFFYELSVGLAAHGCTTLFLAEYPLSQATQYPESTTTDGIVSLTHETTRGGRGRRIEVAKLRGMSHLDGRHVMRILSSGIRVFPRLEATSRADEDFSPSEERIEFGLPELDGLVHGGMPAKTASLMAGGTGVGKTVLGLHFAAAGAARGQRSLLYTFSEPPANLIARAHRVNLELGDHVKSGRVQLVYRPNFELDADEVVERLLEELQRQGIQRLLFEDVDLLEHALVPTERSKAFFRALLIELRRLGVTTIFTRKIAKVVGPELDFSDTALAGIAENLLFLRHVELAGRIHRVLSVLNLRDSSFEPTVREFEIRDSGVQVMAPIESAGGLLTGMARPLGSEVRRGRTP